MEFVIGQRWFSESETELGTGVIVDIEDRSLRVQFPASGEQRCYSASEPPLRRVRFRTGENLPLRDGDEPRVKSVQEVAGLLIYACEDGETYGEEDLADNFVASTPVERLMSGAVCTPKEFSLRREAMEFRHHLHQSEHLGFHGPKLDLLPHQLYAASEVCALPRPRVLLADEVGLGKTIEAGLIMHRLLVTGAASRVLILLPESLINQWFVEMYRKFNQWFSIMDADRFRECIRGNADDNPFESDPLVICNIDWLSRTPKCAAAAMAAEWDLVVIDEVHHLEWGPEKASPQYELAHQLGQSSPGLILLSATPSSLGEEGHFARLRLLDPDRFSSLEAFLAESKTYGATAELAQQVQEHDKLDLEAQKHLLQQLGENHALTKQISQKLTPPLRRKILSELIDRHGTGRLMLRNTRKVMLDFPCRVPTLHPLKAELADAPSLQESPTNHSKVLWLCDLLRKLDPGEKVLCITADRLDVIAIETGIREHINMRMTTFHEGHSLAQRDKNAVYFSSATGARILIASEIGSEGRNFQFCHHLVLFDLPLQFGLIEQRIGRLDRIGQTDDINVHIPYTKGSAEEVCALFYQDGIQAFSRPLHGISRLSAVLSPQLKEVCSQYDEQLPHREDALQALITLAQKITAEVHALLEQGRDRLLELRSFDRERGEAIVADIITQDNDAGFEDFMDRTADHLGIDLEDNDEGVFLLKPAQNLKADLPLVTEEGTLISFHRRIAVRRDDVTLITSEHPYSFAIVDTLLASRESTASFGFWEDDSSRTILVECLFSLEAVASPALRLDRWLPATPIRLLLNHKTEDLSEDLPPHLLDEKLQQAPPFALIDNPAFADKLLPAVFDKAQKSGAELAEKMQKAALAQADEDTSAEITRLQHLAKVNPNVHPEEILLLKARRQSICEAIKNASLRFDSVRLIWKGPKAFLG